MGQKINPYGFRLGITTDWKSRWFSEREYKDYLTEDWTIRQEIMERLESAAISRIEVERSRAKAAEETADDESNEDVVDAVIDDTASADAEEINDQAEVAHDADAPEEETQEVTDDLDTPAEGSASDEDNS